jgi:hypothetical protein
MPRLGQSRMHHAGDGLRNPAGRISYIRRRARAVKMMPVSLLLGARFLFAVDFSVGLRIGPGPRAHDHHWDRDYDRDHESDH